MADEITELDPNSQRAKFLNKAPDVDRAPLPDPPKIPEEIKSANPKLREAWEKYDADLERFFKQQYQRLL